MPRGRNTEPKGHKPPEINPYVAATESAKGSIIACEMLCDPKYEPGGLHFYIAEKLEDSILGRGPKRRIFSVAPRHGKTRLVAEAMSRWALGRFPEKSIVIASYSGARSTKSSKEVRRTIMENPRYRDIFPNTRIRDSENTGSAWVTEQGGGIQATSIGGALTGFGADILIIDDYCRDRQAAESPTIRETAWGWYMSTALTRLSPTGIVFIIATRWHADDLIGRLTNPERIKELQEEGFDEENYEDIKFTAICKSGNDAIGREVGEALWPERWTAKYLNARRAVLSTYEYSALYDQSPKPKTGNVVDATKLTYCNASEVPADLELPRAWDLAVTKRETSDYTAGARGGYHHASGKFYICHIHRRQDRWHQVLAAIGMFGDKEQNRIHVEAQGLAIGLFDDVEKDRRGKNIVSCGTPKADKTTRALPWFSQVDAGNVVLVRGDWNGDFIDEMITFPTGLHDDQIDAVSLLWEKTFAGQTFLYD